MNDEKTQMIDVTQTYQFTLNGLVKKIKDLNDIKMIEYGFSIKQHFLLGCFQYASHIKRRHWYATIQYSNNQNARHNSHSNRLCKMCIKILFSILFVLYCIYVSIILYQMVKDSWFLGWNEIFFSLFAFFLFICWFSLE